MILWHSCKYNYLNFCLIVIRYNLEGKLSNYTESSFTILDQCVARRERGLPNVTASLTHVGDGHPMSPKTTSIRVSDSIKYLLIFANG